MVGQDGTRAQVIARYERWLATQPDLLAALPELAGKTLWLLVRARALPRQVLARLAGEGA